MKVIPTPNCIRICVCDAWKRRPVCVLKASTERLRLRYTGASFGCIKTGQFCFERFQNTFDHLDVDEKSIYFVKQNGSKNVNNGQNVETSTGFEATIGHCDNQLCHGDPSTIFHRTADQLNNVISIWKSCTHLW